MPAFQEQSPTDWDDILLKECERIMATPTNLPNKALRIMKLGDDTEVIADGDSTSTLSEESPTMIHRPLIRHTATARPSTYQKPPRRSGGEPTPKSTAATTTRRLPPELRQRKSTRSLLLNRPPRQETKQKSSASCSFFGSTPLDITDPTSSESSRTLSNFFGTKVDDGRPNTTSRRQSRRTSRQHKPRPKTAKTVTARKPQDPIRAQQLNDPFVRYKSLEELMMERFSSLKLEEAICLVADARTNLGINKWQQWGIQLYEECERLYSESYDAPLVSKSARNVKSEKEPSKDAQMDAVPSLDMPNVSGLQKTPSRRTIGSVPEEASSIEDASGWESSSGWSSLWEDSNALQGGYSLKTYDQNDEYTIDVIKEIERTFLELEAKDRQIEYHRQRRSTTKHPKGKQQGNASTGSEGRGSRNREIQKPAPEKNKAESKAQRRNWFGRFGRKNK